MLFSNKTRPDYPKGLILQSAHIFFRHGARTPTTPYFVKEHGLPTYWPLCTTAGQLLSAIKRADSQEQYDSFQWKRVLETIRKDDGPSPSTEGHNLCNHGELTDPGRSAMLALGKSFRNIYVDQLNLLPAVLTTSEMVCFRSSPFPRALESLQHVLWGFFPPQSRAQSFGPFQIVMRSPRDETLLPNEDYCARFIQICKAYTRRTADRCNFPISTRIEESLNPISIGNNSSEIHYLNSLLRDSMPGHQRVAVDSSPTMHAIHDMINSTAASESSAIKLPAQFYDPRVRDIVDMIAFEEEYSAFQESQEMRRVGIGALLGDVVEKLVIDVEKRLPRTDTEKVPSPSPKLFLAGTHDSTLAAIMVSLGAVDEKTRRKWPPYGSVVSIELFSDPNGSHDNEAINNTVSTLSSIGRTATPNLTSQQKRRLEHHYVRVRYNDQSLVVPGCRETGRNWKGNESFCTLAAFKDIVDRFTPSDWKQACVANLDKPGTPEKVESAGY